MSGLSGCDQPESMRRDYNFPFVGDIRIVDYGVEEKMGCISSCINGRTAEEEEKVLTEKCLTFLGICGNPEIVCVDIQGRKIHVGDAVSPLEAHQIQERWELLTDHRFNNK